MKRQMRKLWLTGMALVAGAAFLLWLYALPPVPAGLQIPDSPEAVARGEYLLTAGGCVSCHRGTADDGDSQPAAGAQPVAGTQQAVGALSGGLGIATPFGTFYAPNITPDPQTGIGGWSAADFIRAMQHGRTPDGGFYYPAFPYRAYAGLSQQEVLDIAAYLMSLPPVANEVPPPQTPFWLWRPMLAGWNFLADLGQPAPETFPDAQTARGAHLARHLGHCGECHTPRNFLGLPRHSREFAGARLGDEVIEPIDAEHLAAWSPDAFARFLLLGIKPDGEFVGGDMNEVIEHNTSRLTEADRAALAAFFTRHTR